MTTGKALLGVLAGLATGVVLGILFAPYKGKNTRKYILRKGEDIADATNDLVKEKYKDIKYALTHN